MKKLVREMYLSPIRDISIRAAQLAAQGNDVISFGAGDSEFNTPEPIKQATVDAIMQNRSHYETIWGNQKLREKIAAAQKERYSVTYQPEEVLITAAGTEAIFDTFLALIEPGDEVIILSPAFINYENCVILAGGIPRIVPVRPENHFQPDPAEVAAACTDRTRMIVINNPCNPTGAVYSPECLAALAKLAVEKDLLVFADEVYDRILYGDAEFRTMASFQGMQERTIVAGSFSKMFAMTGWRLGWLLAQGEVMDALYRVHHYSTACQPTFLQDALAEAMDLPETLKQQRQMVETFAARRQKILAWLQAHPMLQCEAPDGAFYFFVNVRATGQSGRAFCEGLLEKKHVAVVPGEGLGAAFGDYIRMSYGIADARLEEGLDRIDAYLREMA